MKNKTCTKCKETKPIQEFHLGRSRDGHSCHCRSCCKSRLHKYRQSAKGKAVRQKYMQSIGRALSERKYRQSSKGKAVFRKASDNYCKRYPEQRAAHNAVRKACRSGELEQKPCEVCGDPKTEAHHDDYARPLDIRWLCGKHHRDHHHTLYATKATESKQPTNSESEGGDAIDAAMNKEKK